MDFYIDTVGSKEDQDNPKPQSHSSSNSLISKLLEEYRESLCEKTKSGKQPQKQNIVDDFITNMGWKSSKKRKVKKTDESLLKPSRRDLEEVLKKSVLTPEFENSHAVPPIEITKRKLKAQRKKLADSTKGKKWFNLPATEMTDEVKRDLEILKMRSVLDPKRFYKKNDGKVLPKYFQVGKVLDSPLDYYNNRLTKKERKNTLVEELMADAEFNNYNKRKYAEIISEKQKTHYKEWRKAKKLKKRK